jgi:5-methylthioadenosine/S-adenosylhomocysteine deaminase
MSIAITNGNIITMAGSNLGIIKNGAVGIEGSKIIEIGLNNEFSHNDYDEVIDASGQIVMPGLINVHIHTGGNLLRGGAQDVPEIEWMNKAIGPLGRNLDKNGVILGSKIGVIEGVRSGTTTFAEYTSDVGLLIEEVYQPFNVRVAAAENINEISLNKDKLGPRDLYEFDRSKGENEFKKAIELVSKYKDDSLVKSMFGPQALDMISLDLLKTIKEKATELGTQIHMHVAQGGREQLQIEERYGQDKTTISVLKEIKFLNQNLIGAHMHNTSITEREYMVNKGVKMASCQSSISMIDGIVPPLSHYLSLGGIAGLGTDQAPGPGNHNMMREMRTASLLAKISTKDPTNLPAWEVLKVATIGGAKVLGLEKQVGSLEVGKLADIILIDTQRANLVPTSTKPFYNFIPNLVYSTSGEEVDTVIINGKIVIRNKEFLEIPEKMLLKEAQDKGEELFSKGEADWRSANSYLVKMHDKGFL